MPENLSEYKEFSIKQTWIELENSNQIFPVNHLVLSHKGTRIFPLIPVITLDFCSFSYTGEASIVVSHVKKLIEGGVKPADIAVIAPYNLQVGRGDASLVMLLHSILMLLHSILMLLHSILMLLHSILMLLHSILMLLHSILILLHSILILLHSILILYIQTLKPFVMVNQKRKCVCWMSCVNQG